MTEAAAATPTPDVSTLTPAEAGAKLEALQTDSAWASKLLSGDPDAAAQFKSLMERKTAESSQGDQIDRIIAGTEQVPLVDTHPGNQLTVHNQMILADDLKKLGVSDGAIKELFTGAAVDQKTFDRVEEYRESILNDPEWVKRCLSGDKKCARELALISIVRLGGVHKKEAA